MAARQNPQQIGARTLRQLGWILALGLAAAGQLLGPSPAALWLRLMGAAVFAVATVRPSALRPFHTGLMITLRPVLWLANWLAKIYSDRRPPVSPTRRGQIANTGA
ncbi:MAG TPA: hypothetical protein VE988_26680 [Gemmataceae bacterium]|nr:hypothetical protein [Gemmataceae bacterium]